MGLNNKGKEGHQETAQELISRIKEEVEKNENKRSKSISKHTFTYNGVNIDSWKLPDFGFKKSSKLATDIRGLFSITNDKNIHEIVIRGYNKFFAINEVKETKWESLEKHTIGPYTLTLKENGCIIFVSALSDDSLIVASKNSMGSIANGTSIHAEVGETWLEKHLSCSLHSRKQLANVLRQMNATLVFELCDDSFEEHVIGYPPEKSGLYLHGINLNKANFVTYEFDKVCMFASEWGFRQVDYKVFQTLLELKCFLEDSEKTKSYYGKEVEGFVIRCKSNLSDDIHFHDFFFKYKFKEPYFIYRKWRELTHAIISGTYKFNSNEDHITKQYVMWVRLLLRENPDFAKKYKQNHGIVALRKQFLKEYNYSPLDFSERLITNYPLEDRNILLVPIATIGCGKTTLAFALSLLFNFKHIQNDDIPGKKAKIQKFVSAIVDALKHQHAVIADKNNHKYVERDELIRLVSERSPDTRFIALYYNHFDKDDDLVTRREKLNEISKITKARVLERGNNHQTIDASLNQGKTAIGIMNGFLSRFEPLDLDRKPDNLFEDIIILDPMKDTISNLEIVIKRLHKIAPKFVAKIPTTSEMDSAIRIALNHSCPNKISSLTLSHQKLGSFSKRKPEYFGILFKDDLALYIEQIMKDQKKEVSAFWEHLKSSKRVQSTFHVTLIHVSDKSEYPKIWQYYLSQMNSSGVVCSAHVEFTYLVWNSRIMALVAAILDIENKKIQLATPIPHTTIGTENKTIHPKEANDMLALWNSQLPPSDIHTLSLSPQRFNGTITLVYSNSTN
ncbi:hypothetical protein T552_03397 [Pneumocystis carinii B80]|uniref:tRNA ligase n=1 Tax=Pneumocystis carinii (strain B80) TaxID=1408658 RepID=A0A0W4ZBF8_PNEC8|nr:hypothetical protein T552_03397 [Pneumocystis carinii B80]KTW25784.1 hypothetical protein T552_03397 [Pneumocystis carinii B80]